jgi:hypothetical protein
MNSGLADGEMDVRQQEAGEEGARTRLIGVYHSVRCHPLNRVILS